MAKKIFISYGRRDEQHVRDLAGSLRARRYEVWLDKANLKLGEEWWNAICGASGSRTW